MSRPKLIGIGGTLAAGKDTAARMLVESFGYAHLSTGDAVRAEAVRQFGTVDRNVLKIVGNQMRLAQGAGALCMGALAEHRDSDGSNKDLVISGLRAVGEVEAIRERGGLLIFVDAPIEVRYQRLVERGRTGDAFGSLVAFTEFETQEMSSESTTEQNIQAVRDACDVAIDNAVGQGELMASLTRALGDWQPIVA